VQTLLKFDAFDNPEVLENPACALLSDQGVLLVNYAQHISLT
jgi:hypothetical protein